MGLSNLPTTKLHVEASQPDGHGAEDVEEDEAAVSHVISQQVSVAQPLAEQIVIYKIETHISDERFLFITWIQ